ncbi:MAG: hypothetical protein M1821_002030 [Bathelium mastoideum]|nr:MAG: hypothetical protein M1821_002030 [Bathelium mastoideum]
MVFELQKEFSSMCGLGSDEFDSLSSGVKSLLATTKENAKKTKSHRRNDKAEKKQVYDTDEPLDLDLGRAQRPLPSLVIEGLNLSIAARLKLRKMSRLVDVMKKAMCEKENTVSEAQLPDFAEGAGKNELEQGV